jgi:murein DD-endopeptidase MepM/ murein hydrolase activator NlpD
VIRVVDPANFIGYLWPVPHSEDGRYPVVSHEFEPGPRYLPGTQTLNYATHLGVDIMYPRIASDPTEPATHVAVPAHGKNPGWITFDRTPVRAVGPGKIWSAKQTALGHSVTIDHGDVGGVGMLTFYQHMSSFAREWAKGDTVIPGLQLGTMGGDPMNAPHLIHLHLEIWLPSNGRDPGEWPVDPAPYLAHWAKV